MGWWGSLFSGSNSTLSADLPKLGAVGDWSTGQGQGDVTAGTDFYKSILNDDTGKQMSVLAPAINAAKTSANQDIKTNSTFNTRSGGTAASNAATTDKLHGYFADLIGNLKGSAADKLTAAGSDLTKTGVSAYGNQIEASQLQMENWSKSLGGLATTSFVGGLEGFAQGGGAG
jgi:hypothetical protein